MSPIWKMINKADRSSGQSQKHVGSFVSALTGRQRPQVRCFAAGLTAHNKCMLCAGDPVGSGAPVGNLRHRIWECSATSDLRQLHAPRNLAAEILAGRHRNANTSIERALFPDLASSVKPPCAEATFHWHLKPSGGTFSGKVYSDGSRLDGPCSDTARLGWAFVVVNAENVVIANASGIPPDWIVDVPGAEAWAVLQASMVAEPGTAFMYCIVVNKLPFQVIR